MERDELAGWLRLALTPGIGDGTARRLLAAFGLPDAVFGQSQAALEQVCSAAQAKALTAVPPDFEDALARTWQWLREAGGTPVARAIVTLGDVSRRNVLRALGLKAGAAPAGHGVKTDAGPYRIFSSYHCSRLNTNTGRLTPSMFEAVFADGIESGDFRPLDTRLAVTAWLGMHNYTYLGLRAGEHFSVKDAAKSFADIFVLGIATRGLTEKADPRAPAGIRYPVKA